MIHPTRRQFLTTASMALVCACRVDTESAGEDGRIVVRPRAKATTMKGGRLGLTEGRDAILQLPDDVSKPLPLLLFLHGATQNAESMIRRVGPAANEAGVALLAPDSRSTTWDAIRGDFGVDIVYLNRALERVFDGVAVDPARVAIGGFSDGATYAISLGLINGDLFPRVVAFSPGFVVTGTEHGKPQFFISHGTNDQILPIDQTSRMIVPRLKSRGHAVTFREFEGGHQMPPDIARDALGWIAGK